MNRYQTTTVLGGGEQYGTSTAVHRIRLAMSSKALRSKIIVLKEKQRLDILAGIYYGNASLWWIIAAASNIGWGMQVPADTVINVPDLEQVRNII